MLDQVWLRLEQRVRYRLSSGSKERASRRISLSLHTFKGAPGDGAASAATLLADKSGDLYGTTFYGGKYDRGTLFKLHPTSSGYAETIVHSFGYGQDGAYPISGVIEVKGFFMERLTAAALIPIDLV